MRSVSRPFSTLNRLGSFICWGLNNVSAAQLASNGFYYKESKALSQIENQLIEISDLSTNKLLDLDFLSQYYGNGNRLFNSLITENVPLSSTLNYLPPQKLFGAKEAQLEVISSQNNDFVLFANTQGHVQICNSALNLPLLKSIQFFSNDFAGKFKARNQVLKKIFDRSDVFENYKRDVIRKSVPLEIFKKMKPISKE